MEVEWIHKRLQLWHLLQDDQTYTDANLANLLEMSRACAQKWRARLVNVDPTNLANFSSQSRRRHTPPIQITDALRAKIIYYQEMLTERHYPRVGVRNILYHLHQDIDLKRLGVFVPKSASIVYRVLVEMQHILRPISRLHVLIEPCEPM